MTRRAAPQLGVDRMASISWSGEPAVKPLAHQGRASARGLEGLLTLQHPYASDQTGSKSRGRPSFSLALKHGIYREPIKSFIAQPRGSTSSCSDGLSRSAFRSFQLKENITLYEPFPAGSGAAPPPTPSP